MRAIVLEGVNQPLILKETDNPEISPSEVLIGLKAAALNHRDVWIRKGLYSGLKFPVILGSDGAGTVIETGDEVNKEWIDKNVIIYPGLGWGNDPRAQSRNFKIIGLPDDGTFAEYVKVPSVNLYNMPENLTFEQAAAIPLAGLTAYRALIIRANLKKGEKVLITGTGGGVALFALQFALTLGAEVYVTSGSDEKIQKAKELGAIGGINYNNDNWAAELQKEAGNFNVIFDGAGGEGFSKLIELAAPGARITLYGATKGIGKEIDLRKVYWKQLDIQGSTMGSVEDFSEMMDFVGENNILPVIDRVFKLEEAEEAAKRMEASEQFGKIVLRI